jgi:hypothetical protein
MSGLRLIPTFRQIGDAPRNSATFVHALNVQSSPVPKKNLRLRKSELDKKKRGIGPEIDTAPLKNTEIANLPSIYLIQGKKIFSFPHSCVT